jgi:hypothetical protein
MKTDAAFTADAPFPDIHPASASPDAKRLAAALLSIPLDDRGQGWLRKELGKLLIEAQHMTLEAAHEPLPIDEVARRLGTKPANIRAQMARSPLWQSICLVWAEGRWRQATPYERRSKGKNKFFRMEDARQLLRKAG